MSEATEKKQTPKKAAAKEPEKQAGIVVYIGGHSRSEAVYDIQQRLAGCIEGPRKNAVLF